MSEVNRISARSDHSLQSFTNPEQWLAEAATSVDRRPIAVSREFLTESASRPKEWSKIETITAD